MVLKASPFAAFVFHPSRLGEEGGGWIENPNIKMQALRERAAMPAMEPLNKIAQESSSYGHPSVFPYKNQDEDHFAVFMPLIDNPEDNIRLCFMVGNPEGKSFTPPLLAEDSWHELNNPLAIISLSLQRAMKKEVLNQEDIDGLLERINSTFVRIEAYISGQIELS